MRPLVGCLTAIAAGSVLAQGGWPNHAGNPQHTNISPFSAQAIRKVLWSAPVDLAPSYAGSSLLSHYASPLVTARGTVVISVKTGADDGFKVQGRKLGNGSVVWSLATDYSLPPYNWTPTCAGTIAPDNSLYVPAGGGTVLRRASADSAVSATTRIAFYGNSLYNKNTATFNQNVKICTPISNDSKGNIYFGFRVLGENPAGLTGGLAKIDVNGNGLWVAASAMANDVGVDRPAMSCAPALSNDESIVYIGARGGSSDLGYLCAVNASTLAPINRARLMVPQQETPTPAFVLEDSTSTPMVGPDGDVYYGAWYYNNYRGFLLHFDASLTVEKVPASFGWDITPSIVPTSMIPDYQGPSSYLIFMKYNNYLEGSGGGMNRVAVLDPNVEAEDEITGKMTMMPVRSLLAPTPDPRGGFIEWCVNTTAVDPSTNTAIVNSEDGKCYQWNLATDKIIEDVRLTAGLGEAYTSTIIGPDGISFAMSNATVFALWDGVVPTAVNAPEELSSGEQVQGSVDLSNKATGGGAHISLKSSHPDLLKVPAAIDVPRGKTSALFNIRAAAVEADTDVRITATRYGETVEKTISLRGARISALTSVLSALYVPAGSGAGESTSGSVQVAGNIPAGATVTLWTDSARLSVSPTSVPVSNETPQGDFTLTSNGPITETKTVHVIAKIGSSTQSLAIELRPKLHVASFTLAKSEGFESQFIRGTVTLNAPAGPGGAPVTLSGNAVFKLPSNFTVPENATSADFAIGLLACGPTAITRSLSASLGGNTINRSITVKPVMIVSFIIDPNSVIGGVSTKGWVQLNAKAGSAFTLMIDVSVDGSKVFVPAQVAVPSGSSAIAFDIATLEVSSTTKRRVTVARNGASISRTLTMTR